MNRLLCFSLSGSDEASKWPLVSTNKSGLSFSRQRRKSSVIFCRINQRESSRTSRVDGGGYPIALFSSVFIGIPIKPPTTKPIMMQTMAIINSRTIGYSNCIHRPPFLADKPDKNEYHVVQQQSVLLYSHKPDKVVQFFGTPGNCFETHHPGIPNQYWLHFVKFLPAACFELHEGVFLLLCW